MQALRSDVRPTLFYRQQNTMTITPIDFRALCAELKAEANNPPEGHPDPEPFQAILRERAAALAQPEPQGPGPSDMEIIEFWSEHCAGDGDAGILRLARWGRPAIKPEGTITEPRGCPTPGACSCPTAPYVPPELIRALELAEAALADIGDAEREPGDDLAWAESRSAQDLPRIRAVLARWGRPAVEPEINGQA